MLRNALIVNSLASLAPVLGGCNPPRTYDFVRADGSTLSISEKLLWFEIDGKRLALKNCSNRFMICALAPSLLLVIPRICGTGNANYERVSDNFDLRSISLNPHGRDDEGVFLGQRHGTAFHYDAKRIDWILLRKPDELGNLSRSGNGIWIGLDESKYTALGAISLQCDAG